MRVVTREPFVHERRLRDLRILLDDVVIGKLEKLSLGRRRSLDAPKVEQHGVVTARRHDPPLLFALLRDPRELALDQRRALGLGGVFRFELEKPRRGNALAGAGAKAGGEVAGFGIPDARVQQHEARVGGGEDPPAVVRDVDGGDRRSEARERSLRLSHGLVAVQTYTPIFGAHRDAAVAGGGHAPELGPARKVVTVGVPQRRGREGLRHPAFHSHVPAHQAVIVQTEEGTASGFHLARLAVGDDVRHRDVHAVLVAPPRAHHLLALEIHLVNLIPSAILRRQEQHGGLRVCEDTLRRRDEHAVGVFEGHADVRVPQRAAGLVPEDVHGVAADQERVLQRAHLHVEDVLARRRVMPVAGVVLVVVLVHVHSCVFAVGRGCLVGLVPDGLRVVLALRPGGHPDAVDFLLVLVAGSH